MDSSCNPVCFRRCIDSPRRGNDNFQFEITRGENAPRRKYSKDGNLHRITLRYDSISVIGVIWAMQSMHEIAEEIDEIYKTKRVHLISLIGIIMTAVLAVLLMINPFEHITVHVRILGFEIIASIFVRRVRTKKLSKQPQLYC